MTIVTADGVDTELKKVDRLKISVAEIYDENRKTVKQ